MLESITMILAAVISLITFAFALYFMYKLIYHMYKLINNVTGKHAYLLGALLLFMPDQFNGEGNEHRVKVLSIFPKFLLCFVIAFLSQLLIRYLSGDVEF